MLTTSPPPLFQLTKQSRHVFYYRHAIINIARSFFADVARFDDPMFSLLLLKEMGKQWSDPMFDRTFIKHSITIATQYPSLYAALCSHISVIIDRYGFKSVITALEFQSLDIVSSLTPQFVVAFPITLITPANIDKIWGHANVLGKPDVAFTFQSIMAVSEPYPQPARLLRNSNLLSLVNDIVDKRRSFVNLVRGLAHAAIMMKDFSSLQAILETLPDFRAWLFLADYRVLQK
jgi:hypothetical protein